MIEFSHTKHHPTPKTAPSVKLTYSLTPTADETQYDYEVSIDYGQHGRCSHGRVKAGDDNNARVQLLRVVVQLLADELAEAVSK